MDGAKFMKIKINLLNNKISAEGVQGEQVNKVIDGFFNFLCGPTKTPADIKNPVIKVETQKILSVPVSTSPKTQQVVKEEPKSESPSVSKVLPKINDQRTLNTSIGELIMPLKPSNIREIGDGIKLYQTHYTCDCGHTGYRFIRETNDYTKCHECGEKLLVEPATLEDDADGIPMPDLDGNFFIARELYEGE